MNTSNVYLSEFVSVGFRFLLIGFCAGVALRKTCRPKFCSLSQRRLEDSITLVAVLTAGAGLFVPVFAGFCAILLAAALFFHDNTFASGNDGGSVNPGIERRLGAVRAQAQESSRKQRDHKLQEANK